MYDKKTFLRDIHGSETVRECGLVVLFCSGFSALLKLDFEESLIRQFCQKFRYRSWNRVPALVNLMRFSISQKGN